MEEELPSNFDVIIVGTGMPESILAAAAARSGKTVLHLDANDHYGGDWGSFNFDQLNDWAQNTSKCVESDSTPSSMFEDLKKIEEQIVILPKKSTTVFNLKTYKYIPDTIPKDVKIDSDTNKHETSDPVAPVIENIVVAADTELCEPESVVSDDSEIVQKQTVPNTDNAIVTKTEKIVWSLEELHNQRRKFNLDLAPKLLFSKGALVELLIQSNISRYSEFKCSSQILTLLGGKLMPVPCSRADVFSTKHVSIVEKRMLMKLLSFCLNFEDHPEEYKQFENKPFSVFLNSKKLTPNVSHYVIHSIAMVDPNHPTLESLQRLQKFLQSLGRYGNSPFLFPLYGSGEMPQCFCRLCAVFGGVYCLKRNVQALILNRDNKCTACVVNNKRVNCNLLAMECSYSPEDYIPSKSSMSKISKAILITDAPIYPSEHDQLTFLCLPASDFLKNAVNVLELGSTSNVCPKGLRIVYLSCQSHYDSSEEDLYYAAQLLLNFNKDDVELNEDAAKPNLIWALYFNQYDTSLCDLNAMTPENVFLMSTPDIEQDYEIAIKQAKDIFSKVYPTEEFLPRAPDSEEIILESDEPEKNAEQSKPIEDNKIVEETAEAIGICDVGASDNLLETVLSQHQSSEIVQTETVPE